MAKTKSRAGSGAGEQSRDEQIGFHKGSLSVLARERQEMQRILGIIEQLMQMHLSELKGLGVDLSTQVKKEKIVKKKPPIDELL